MIDASPRALGSGYRVYEGIFSDHQIVYSDSGMRGYVIPEKEFKIFFDKLNKNTAQFKNENKEEASREPSSTQDSSQESSPEASEESRAIERKRELFERLKKRRMARKAHQALSRSEHSELLC